MIYPQEIWYGGVKESDVPRIVEKTIQQGEILDDLLIADDLLNTKGGRQKPTTGSDVDVSNDPPSTGSAS